MEHQVGTNPYNTLHGGVGSEQKFRTERIAVQQWLNRVRPLLVVEEQSRKIHDLSMNGLSFFVASELEAPAMDSVVHVVLSLESNIVYEGHGQVTRSERTSRGGKVGLRLVEGFLDIPKIVALHDELALNQELASGPASDATLIPAEYRRVCGDIVHLIRRYRSLLNRSEALLGTRGEAAKARLERICLTCEGRFREEWNEHRAQANRLVNAFESPEVVQAARRFTQTVVTPELKEADNWRRCYDKPLGYPGDYEIMWGFYDGKRVGRTAFARLLYQMGLEQPIAACVVKRMLMLSDHIRQTMQASWEGTGAVGITSLGSGPAREVELYLEHHVPPRAMHVTLIDQDDQALSFAYRRVYRQMARVGTSATAACLYASFGQLLKDPELFMKLPDQHLIYSAGLFDYLSRADSQQLVAGLYRKLVPGGRLIVGNMKSPSDARWSPEYILDWPLIYRTELEMRDLAAKAEGAEVTIEEDPSGYTYLMILTRPHLRKAAL